MTARSSHMRTSLPRQASTFQTDYAIGDQDYRVPSDSDAASRSGRNKLSWSPRPVEASATGYARCSKPLGIKRNQDVPDLTSSADGQLNSFQPPSIASYENRMHSRQLRFNDPDLGASLATSGYGDSVRSTGDEGHRSRNRPEFSSMGDSEYGPPDDYSRPAFARRSANPERHDMMTHRPPSPPRTDPHSRGKQQIPYGSLTPYAQDGRQAPEQFRAEGSGFQALSHESAEWGPYNYSQPAPGEVPFRGGYRLGREDRPRISDATAKNSRYDDEMLPRFAERSNYAGVEQDEKTGRGTRHLPSVSKEPVYDGYWGDNGASAFSHRRDGATQGHGYDVPDDRHSMYPGKPFAEGTQRPYSERQPPSDCEGGGYRPMYDDRSSSFNRYQPPPQHPSPRSIRDTAAYEARDRWQGTSGTFYGGVNRRDRCEEELYRRTENVAPWSRANAPEPDRSGGRNPPYMQSSERFPRNPVALGSIRPYTPGNAPYYTPSSQPKGDMRELFQDIETIKANLTSKKPRYEFRKNFYMEHPAVANMSREASDEERHKRNIHIIQPTDLECIPNPVLTFEQASFPETITNRLQEFFSAPTAIQVQGWPIALSGHNMIGIAETGCGKTLAFILPALIHIKAQHPVGRGEGPVALVLAPTRELAEQIGQEAARFAVCMDQRVVTIFGQMDGMRDALDEVRQGVHILVACPGKLMDFCRRSYLTLDRVTYFVLDEADRLLDMGYQPQIEAINSLIREDRQILMWSATWPEDVRKLVRTIFPSRSPLYHIQVGSGSKPVATLKQEFVYASTIYAKEELFYKIMSENATKLTLVFANTKRTVDQLANELPRRTETRVFPVKIHGDLPQTARRAALDSFREKRNNCLIATELASRGLDVQNILLVVNYDCPQDIEAYIHRVGRTGRAGRAGTSITIVTPSDVVNNAQFFENIIPCLQQNHQVVATWLEDMAQQAANSSRGRAQFARYGVRGKSRSTNLATTSATEWSAAEEWRQWSVTPAAVTASDATSENQKNSAPPDNHAPPSLDPPDSGLSPVASQAVPDVKEPFAAAESLHNEKTTGDQVCESIDPSPRSTCSTPTPSTATTSQLRSTSHPGGVAQNTKDKDSSLQPSHSAQGRSALDSIKRELGGDSPLPARSTYSPHLPVKTEDEEDGLEGNAHRPQAGAAREGASTSSDQVVPERGNTTPSTPRPSAALNQQQEDLNTNDDNDDWAASVPQWSPPRP